MREKANVLLVDDNPDGILSLEAMLEDLDYNLVKARSGREALRHLLENDFAVILLDVQMPEMDGYETAEAIRQRPRSRHTPIIFLTAYQQSEVHLFRGYAAGAVDFLFKPVNPEILRSKVRVFVDLARQTAEAKRLNEALRERAEQLAASNRDLDTFAHTVSHDLKAPLRAIIAFTQMLVRDLGESLDPKTQVFLDRIISASTRMSELIEDLMTLSHVTRSQIERENVDLARLAEEIVRTQREADPSRQIEYSITPQIQVTADAGLARIVLENLLGNAWKYTSKTDCARIEVGMSEEDNGERVIFVADNGAGFDISQADNIFAPFQRFHSSSEFEGTGIGLATVKRIIDRHGGWIKAESAVGEGAIFSFTLEEAERVEVG